MRKFIEPRPQQIDEREQEEQENRGVVTIPYLKGLSEQFRRRTANRHSFRVAFKPGRKIKEIKRTCQEPLGERQKRVVYTEDSLCLPGDCVCGRNMASLPDKEERTHG